MQDILFQPNIELLPNGKTAVAFVLDSSTVFREDTRLDVRTLPNGMKFIPWGADNMMPYNIISKIEDDETLATCQQFNAEVCYGAGLRYNADQCTPQVKDDIEEFFMNNDLATYFLGVCQDFKYFAFAVTVIIFNKDGSKVVRLVRKEACNCRFAPADKRGSVPAVLFADWRNYNLPDTVERIPLLNTVSPWVDLQDRLKQRTKDRKFAILTRIPTPDYCYYPIPYYAALFKSKWYDIKRLIADAKEAKLRNSAPIKYQIEIASKYWETIFRAEGITVRGFWQEVKKAGRLFSFAPNSIRANYQERAKTLREEIGAEIYDALPPIFTEMPFIRLMGQRRQLPATLRYIDMNPQRLATKRLMPGFFRVQTGIELAGRTYRGVGNIALLQAERYAPVHVRRMMVEAAEHGEPQQMRDYMNGCVVAARKGTVMVSPFISPQEKQVMEVLLKKEHPFIYIADNGFRDYYKPQDGLFDAVAAGRVLILSPWDYDADKRHVTRADCVMMNQMAEEICNHCSLSSIEP